MISCGGDVNIESIITNVESGSNSLDSHIQKITDKKQCNPPYYNLKFLTTNFELVSDAFDINSSQNLSFRQNDTIAFTVTGNGYNLILSNHENLKWLNKMENELSNDL